MQQSENFSHYLDEFRKRLDKLAVARGLALLAAAALLISVATVTLAARAGFPDNFMLVSRLLLIAALVVLGWFYVVLPRRRIEQHHGAEIEARTPDFDGRVEAFQSTDDAGNPLREILAEESLRIAANNTPEQRITHNEFRNAWSATVASIAVLVLLAVAGPGNYAYGVRDLWLGWAFPGLLPPQSIEVTPGDDGIRFGGNLRIAATAQGFDPNSAVVNVRFADNDWQQVEMSPSGTGFEFTFFSVRQELEYFVSANNVRSPSYSVQVVDLPNIENLALSYHFPEWTGLEPEVHDPGGDVRTIVDTEVEVTITSDRAMTPGDLVIGDRTIPLQTDGDTATATFTVEADGKYYIAANVGGEQIRLTDDYFITIKDDEAPQIEFARPGRDWSASRIEEVTARVTATDDYAIESLLLNYSVNGGDWQSVALDKEAENIDHVFFLESLSAEGDQQALNPGDLISYYAVAEDRQSSARTDIFFIDVQPFDRLYSQSQTGGGMGGQQGAQQDEISQRQREIIISTWNLIREQSDQRRDDAAYVTDNSALLARLQTTLKEQVESLASRTEARRLTNADEDIARFVDNLTKAAAAMTPAAERLAVFDLEQALLPEQEALQHLLAAEAVFTDINISTQANNGGAGGGQAGRDLAEMFELEMDLEKNQYETGSNATPEPPQQQMQETADELADLARRQEQLAKNQQQNRTPVAEQRWQQEMLRRELEELQERLEQMAQQQDASASSAGQSSTEPSSTGPSSTEQSAGASGQSQSLDDLQRRLSSALRAMDDADMEEAARQLEGAQESASQAQNDALQASVNDLAIRAEELHATQSDIEQRLQDAVRSLLDSSAQSDQFSSGLSYEEEDAIAADKREVLAKLQKLQQDARGTARSLEESNPRAADELKESIRKLQDQEIEARIAVAAAYIEQGDAVYVASSESAVTEGLREFSDSMQRTTAMLGGNNRPGEGDQAQQALASVRALRRSLQEISTDNAAAGDSQGDSTDAGAEIEEQAARAIEDVNALLRRASSIGLRAGQTDDLRRLSGNIGQSEFNRNPELIAREARRLLSLVEQLELALAAAVDGRDNALRTNPNEDIPEAHREMVADYYRQLGQTD